jgi:hypothetical protein
LQRICSLKGRKVRAVVDNDWMSVLCGVGKEGRKVPPFNISRGGIIEVIPLIIITREGGELKNLGAGGGSRNDGRGDSRGWKGGIKIHVREGEAAMEGNKILILWFFLRLSKARSTTLDGLLPQGQLHRRC